MLIVMVQSHCLFVAYIFSLDWKVVGKEDIPPRILPVQCLAQWNIYLQMEIPGFITTWIIYVTWVITSQSPIYKPIFQSQ